MGPRQLQSQIHADYTTELASWEAYRTGVTGLYAQAVRKDDYNSHLIREYNRKIHVLNQPTGLFIAPFDAGYSFIGSYIDAPIGIENIEGYAFPQETLSAPNGSSYTWSIDGSTVGTSQTFTPTIYHIGKTVSCLVDGTNYSTTVWHPNQIPAVKAFWWANYGVYKTGVDGQLSLAQDEDPVVQWQDVLNDRVIYGGGQGGLLANMATYETADIYSPSIQSNDTTDFQVVDETAENTFDSVEYGYCFMGAKDPNHTGNAAGHTLFASMNSTVPTIAFGTRRLGQSQFFLQSTKSGGSTVLITGSDSNSNYNVLTAEVLFKDSISNLRVNGSVNASGILSGNSLIAPASSTSMYVNRAYTVGASSPSYITAIIFAAGNSKLSDADRNKIERFIGLLGNVDIPFI